MVTYISIAALIFAVLSFTLMAFHVGAYARFVTRVKLWSAGADRRIEHLKNLGNTYTDPKTGALLNPHHPKVQKRAQPEAKS